MKRVLFLTLVLTSFFIRSQETQTTTIYLIRHAEKADASKNSELSEQGIERALRWANYFEEIPLEIFYTTLTIRTQQTISSVASTKNKEIQFYQPATFSLKEIAAKHPGKTILIVGHSNTIPKHINDFLGEEIYEQIDENEFGNLYTISITNNKVHHQLTKPKL